MEREIMINTSSELRKTYKFNLKRGQWYWCSNGVKDLEKGDIFYMDEPTNERVKDKDGYEIFVAVANPILHEETGRMQVECFPVPTFKEK